MTKRSDRASPRRMILRGIRRGVSSFGLSVVIIFCLLPQPGFGFVGDGFDRALARSGFSPIGSMEAPEFTTVNSKPVHGTTAIWSGDILCVPPSGSARVIVDSIAELSVVNGAKVAISTSGSFREGTQATPTVVASLANGQLRMQLHDGASAYIEAADATITAVGRADFQVTIRNREAVVERYLGVVRIQREIKERLSSILYSVVPRSYWVPPNSRDIAMKEGKKAIFLYRFLKKPRIRSGRGTDFEASAIRFEGAASQVDPPEVPALGRRIVFERSPRDLGEFTPASAVTNQNGEVEVEFIAGRARRGTITARFADINPAEEDETIWKGNVTVLPLGLLERHKTKIIIGAIATVTIGFCVWPPKPRLSHQSTTIIPTQ